MATVDRCHNRWLCEHGECFRLHSLLFFRAPLVQPSWKSRKKAVSQAKIVQADLLLLVSTEFARQYPKGGSRNPEQNLGNASSWPQGLTNSTNGPQTI